MARLRDARPKNVSGAYDRIFDNAELGALASKIQSAVISSGNELERLIAIMVQNIPDLDQFLTQEIMPDGVFLVRKKEMKKCQTLDFAGAEPDFMVFKRRDNQQTCHIIELKDGHVFDTKKSSAERQAMHGFIERNAPHIQYRFQAHFCAFNQEDKHVIRDGFKRKISLEQAMTGREFCELLEIDYDNIVAARKADGPDNIEFFLSELARIEAVRPRLIELLNIYR
ncbi:MAG: hypothetical protein OXC10_04935 [Rhodospirillaceae bacterium]|nr:hypothetical protein [Rhodospirillaceae bacterium]